MDPNTKDNVSYNDIPVNRQGKQSLIPIDRQHGQRLVKGINQLLERGSGTFSLGPDDGEKVVFSLGESMGQERSSTTQQERSGNRS